MLRFQAPSSDSVVAQAYRDGGHTETAIAQAAGLSVSRVSRLISAFEAKGNTGCVQALLS